VEKKQRKLLGGVEYLSMKSGWKSTKGYAQCSDLSVDRCASYELNGDVRHNKVFIQVRPP
jgi:hypothetical protein